MYIVENWQYINGYYRRITRKFEVEADAMTAYNNTRAGGITNPTVLYKEQKDYLVKIIKYKFLLVLFNFCFYIILIEKF